MNNYQNIELDVQIEREISNSEQYSNNSALSSLWS